MSRTGITTAARIGLGSVFGYAGFVKILNPAAFYRVVEAYHLTGDRVSWGLSHYLPWLELTTGAVLILGAWKKQALEIMGGLLVMFIPALVLAWSRGMDMSCGCFGNHPGPTAYLSALSRDLLLLALTVMLWRRERTPPPPKHAHTASDSSADLPCASSAEG